MGLNKFSKPPLLTEEEKERRAEAFINLVDDKPIKLQDRNYKVQKEQSKPLFLRVPQSLWEEIHNIMAMTGLSKNAICLELLRPAIKKKLKELKEEEY